MSAEGIQAQTLSVFHQAQEAGLKLLPVLNKTDLGHAAPDEVSAEIQGSLGLPAKDHLRISAKSGAGVDALLARIIEMLPPPRQAKQEALQALVFDT